MNRLFFILIFVSVQKIFSFPCDYNSLTCDKNFENVPLSPPIKDNRTNEIRSSIDKYIQSNYFRKDSRNISNDNGRTIHVTKWGDSLSDFVQFYDLREPAYLYYPHYSI